MASIRYASYLSIPSATQPSLPLTFTFTYDTRPPVITQSFPRAGEIVTSSLEAVTVGLSEDGGAGIDLANSAVKFFLKIGSGPLVTVPGVQSNDGVDTLIFTLDGPLASDGSDDGAYQVEVIPQDVLGNTPQTPETFEFTYAVRAPALVSTTPEAGSLLNETLNQVVAVLRDRSGTGLDLVTFTLTLRKAPFGGGLSQVVAGGVAGGDHGCLRTRGAGHHFHFHIGRCVCHRWK